MIHSCPMSLLAISPPGFHSGFIANSIVCFPHTAPSQKRKNVMEEMSQECHTLHRLLAFENFRDASGSQALKKDECLSVLTECCSSYITPNLLPSLLTFPFYSHSKIVTKLLFVLTSAGLVSVFAFDLTVSNSVMSFRRHIHWPWSARLT